MLGDPRRCAHLKSPTVAAIQRVHPRIPCLREPRVPSLRSIRPADRGPAVRCGSAGGGGRGECWARARARGVSGAPIWCVTHGAVPTWKARACSAYSGPITHLVWHHTLASRSLRRSGQRIADRRCGTAAGGRARWRALGSWLLTRLFRGAPPYGVRPTELCLPEKLNPVRHTAGPSRIPRCTPRPRSVRPDRPVAPLDPAGGSRTGGARRLGEVQLVVGDRKVPVPAVASRRAQRVVEPADRGAVDGCAHLEDHVIRGGDEVQVGREPSVTTEPTLAQARPALEDQFVRAEHLELCKQVQQVVLGDVQQRGVVGVPTTSGVASDERPGQTGHWL